MTPSRKPRSIAATPEGIQKLKDARKEKGLTNQTISDETYKKYGNAGISEASVNNFITKKKPVQPESVIKIIEVLGLKPEDIVALEEWQIVTGEVKRHKNSKNKPINWHEICQKQATQRQKITTNSLTFKDGINHSREQLYVPLGLVERKKRERRTDELFPEKGSQMYAPETYEVTQTYAQKRFFEEVIQQGKSNSQGKRLAVIGEPGAGKSTLLQELEQEMLDRTDLIPVWVSLASLGEKTLEDYLLNNWLKEVRELIQVTPEDIEVLKQLFKDKKVWLLLDGADEMSGRLAPPLRSAQSQNVLGDIATQINGWLASARVILTCRLNVWDGEKNALDAFDTYRTLEFSYPEQVHLFIEKWFDSPQPPEDRENLNPPQPPLKRGENGEKGENGESLAVELKRQLEEPDQSRIRDLIKNPLRLALLCRTWQRHRGNLPETQAELYGRFVEDFYIWKGDEFPTTSQQQKQLNQGLGELALRAIEGEKSRFRLTHGFVCQVLGEPDTELHQLALELGWLNRVGVAAENPDEPVYAFYHATFQEYFAALAVEDWDYFLPKDHVNFPVEGKKYRIFEPQWKQVILLWLGREDVKVEEKEAFIEKLVNFEDGFNYNFYKFRAQFLASWLTQEFKDSKWTNLLIDWLIRTGLGWYDSETKKWEYIISIISGTARQVLTQTNTKIVKNKILEILDNSNESFVLSMAIYCLGEMKFNSDDVIDRLLLFIHKSSKDSTKYKTDSLHFQAIESISKIALADQKIISFFKDLIDGNIDFSTKIRSIKALAKISPEFIDKAIEILMEMFEDEKNDEIRYYLASTLVEVSPKNIDFVVKFLSSKSSNKKSSIALTQLENSLLSSQEISASKEKVNFVRSQEKNLASKIIEFSVNMKIHLNNKEIEKLNSFRESNKIEIEFYQLLLDIIQSWNSEPLKYFIVDELKSIKKTRNELIFIVENFSNYCAIDFDYVTYELLWDCATNLPYPEFYQAWHHPIKMTHPEVEDNTPVGNATVKSQEILLPYLRSQLQNRPIYCLDAYILANETDNSEIALTLCQLIWEQAFPNEAYPKEVTTPSKLREHLKTLKLRQNLPKLAILIDRLPCDQVIEFCQKLTNIVAIAFLTDEPLEAPLKGFPPSQSNLLSAIQSWLEEIKEYS